MCRKVPISLVVKTAAERGRIGAWAYEARADADMSVEQVVARLERSGNGVSAATIRGIEGGSKKPSRRLLRALATIYERRSPDDMAQAGDMGDTPVPGLAAYLERIDALVATVDRLIAQHEADRAIIASLIGLPGGGDAERWKSFREWQASNPLRHDPALTGR